MTAVGVSQHHLAHTAEPLYALEREPVVSGGQDETGGSGCGIRRRFPIGAELVTGGVHFRVWAPDRHRVEVVVAQGIDRLEGIALASESRGYFSGLVPGANSKTLYWFRLDGGQDLYADPMSRFQPEGPMGPSQVVDPTYTWMDHDWRGVSIEGQVIYEMHVGAFTQAGTWLAASEVLPELAATGITMIEMMPIGDFEGSFGWGYDGVNLFAPTRLYGNPADLRTFIDRAHGLGLAVILDVVYNHLGPVGNVLPQFAQAYFTDRYKTDWGKPLNFDGADAAEVREYFILNARYWIEEYHFDGLRIDATQNIYDRDETNEHILAAITRVARDSARSRSVVIIAENEPQDVRLTRPPTQGGFGMDALWNDDFHHAAMVALTGRKEAYYTDYHGNPQEFVSTAKYSFLYQGQRYKWQQKPRGTPTLDIAPPHFINFLQNHDQLANTGVGERIHRIAGPGRFRAMTAYLLLLPQTPMLFMGQEFGASTPFLYFADLPTDLATLVDEGRKDFLSQFRSLATPAMKEVMLAPGDPATFERCKLDHEERQRNVDIVALHKDLLRLRRDDPVLGGGHQGRGLDGACLGPGAFVLRYFGERDDRLMLVNLDVDLHLDPAPEPLLAPTEGRTWEVLWSSEDPAYGGLGTPVVYGDEGWRLPGGSCVVLGPATRCQWDNCAASVADKDGKRSKRSK